MSCSFFSLVSPEINTLSNNQTYLRGENVSLTCMALGGPSVFYQWLMDGSDLEGENSSTLMLRDVNASTGGVYTCVASNSAGNNSADVSVFITPYFITEPQDVGGLNGTMVSLTCLAEAFPSPSYQWFREGGRSLRDSLNASSDILSFALIFEDEGRYFCNVSSQDIVLQSRLATLSGKKMYFRFLFNVTAFKF